MRIAFPDPLTWQSGIEFGLQALGELHRRGIGFTCRLRDEGPMLEAATFAMVQYGLQSRFEWVRRAPRVLRGIDVALFPRVAPGDLDVIRFLLQQGVRVVTSDPAVDWVSPGLHTFPRRHSRVLADCLLAMSLEQERSRQPEAAAATHAI